MDSRHLYLGQCYQAYYYWHQARCRLLVMNWLNTPILNTAATIHFATAKGLLNDHLTRSRQNGRYWLSVIVRRVTSIMALLLVFCLSRMISRIIELGIISNKTRMVILKMRTVTEPFNQRLKRSIVPTFDGVLGVSMVWNFVWVLEETPIISSLFTA